MIATTPSSKATNACPSAYIVAKSIDRRDWLLRAGDVRQSCDLVPINAEAEAERP